MLTASPELVYVDEPFNLYHHLLFQPTIFDHWFTYVLPENEQRYFKYLQTAIEAKFNLVLDANTIKTGRDRQRLLQTYLQSLKKRWTGARPLVKDPIALFSAEWLANTFNMDVVLTIRHPAAFAYSLKRANWTHDFSHFLAQPLLMRDYLHPFAAQISEYAASEKDIIDQAALLWKLIHYRVSMYQVHHSNWIFVRHEDLSRDPIAQFAKLFQQLNIAFSLDIQATIADYSRPDEAIAANPQLGFSKRDSRAIITSWKSGLSPSEIERIRHQVGDVASSFYSEQDW
ncbi:sulfotransferase [Oculatella sp. LEGE 06141]